MRFGVVGDPVDHSRSPIIHNAAYRVLEIDATFEAIPVPADAFDQVVTMLRSGELDGVNVTMPHKHNAFASVDGHSDAALRTGAVNTITVDSGKLIGHNTDVAGVIAAYEWMAADPEAPTLVLGAGGAAAAAVVARDTEVFVSARTEDDIRALAGRIDADILPVPWGEGVAGAVVINATPIGMHGESLPSDALVVASALLDMTYADVQTPAVNSFRSDGRPLADGIDMLVGQAVEAFSLFLGEPGPRDVMMTAARTSVG
jgi:shikimate dehydrogenase